MRTPEEERRDREIESAHWRKRAAEGKRGGYCSVVMIMLIGVGWGLFFSLPLWWG